MSDRNIQISFKADQNRQIKVLDNLIEEGVEPDIDGEPVLVWLAEEGHTELVKKLEVIRRKNVGFYSNLTFSTETFSKALYMASKNGHTQIVQILMKNSIVKISDVSPVNTKYNYDYGNYNKIIEAFLISIKQGHTEIAKLYIEAGIDPTVKNNNALYYASDQGHTQIVEMLIKPILKKYENRKKQIANKKRRYILDNDEKEMFDSIFYMAAYHGHTEILKLLLKLQKKLYENYKARSLNDELVRIATIQGHTQMVKELVNVGINSDSHYIQEALEIAAKYKRSEIERILKNA